MTTSKLSQEEFGRAIGLLFPQSKDQELQPTPINESLFDQIRKLLELSGKPEWSIRPRTYTVLLMIGRLDVMDAFVDAGLLDIQFPYPESRLPASLVDQPSRDRFMKSQLLVLTKATDVENGYHKHFTSQTVSESCFIVVKQLGSGGTGVVDHVISKLSLKEYARKRIRRRILPRGRDATKEFENELWTLKKLSHHHLVEFIGSYTDPESIGLLLAPVADCDLKALLERKPFRNSFILRQAFGCLCSAVQYLHSQSCRHKDIKPANILIKNGEVFITDFGTARDWSEAGHATTTGITGPYTPAYAAPEVAGWEPRNKAADIWSLGCVYLDMLTVLKGEDSESRITFFKANGSGNLNPRTNRAAYLSWLLRLEKVSLTDNQPIKWIQQMLEEGPLQRITALGLLSQIHEYRDHDNDLIYYGHCCAEEVSDLSSICHSSIAGNLGETAVLPKDGSHEVPQKDTDAHNLKVPRSRAARIPRAIRDANAQMARTRDSDRLSVMCQESSAALLPVSTSTSTSAAAKAKESHRNQQTREPLHVIPANINSANEGNTAIVRASKSFAAPRADAANSYDWIDCNSSDDENADPLQTSRPLLSSKQKTIAANRPVLQICQPGGKVIPITEKWIRLNPGCPLPPNAIRRNFEDTSASEDEADDGRASVAAGPQAEQLDPGDQATRSQPSDLPNLGKFSHTHECNEIHMENRLDDPDQASQSKFSISIEEPTPDPNLLGMTKTTQQNSIESAGNSTAHISRSRQRGPPLAVVTESEALSGNWNDRLNVRLVRIRRYIAESEESMMSPRSKDRSLRPRIHDWKHCLEIDEKPFAFLKRNYSPDTLGKWIYDASLQHFGPNANEHLFKELWITLVKFSCFFAVAGTCAVDQLTSEDRRALVEFGRRARRIRRRFQRLVADLEDLLSHQRFEGHRGDSRLPRSGPNDEVTFLKAIFRSHKREEVVSAMRDWCGEFEQDWMTDALQPQARNNVEPGQPSTREVRPRPSPEIKSGKLRHGPENSANAQKTAHQLLSARNLHGAPNSLQVLKKMKIASCIDDNCEFCFSSLMEDKHSREAKGPDRNSKATISTQGKTDHKNSCRTTFEAEILFHRGFTSIDRNLVNPAALEKANKHFTESKDQKFIIVRDALSEAEVEALVIRTAVIRNTRKQQKGLQYKEANVVATQADDHIMERKERAEPTLAQLDEKQRPSNPSDASAVGMVGQIPSVESPMSPSEKRVLISPHTEMSSNMTERGIALSKKTNTRRRRRVYSSQNSRSSRTTFKYEGSPSTSTLLSRQSNGSEAPGRWHTGETPSRRPHVASPRRKQSTKPLPSKRSRRSLSSEFREPHTPTMPSQNHQRTPIPRQETARASTRSRKVYGIPEHDEKESNAADTSTPVPTHRIIHQRSHPALRPDDHWSEDPADLSLENTLRVVRKASAWFKKIRGGRRSAPPNESATAASRRGWK